MKLLKINSSVQRDKSTSRKLVDELADVLSSKGDTIVHRDLAEGVSLLSREMVEAFYTDPQKLTREQKQLLTESDTLIQELQQADTLILGIPIYNFSVPASVKAYFDLVARAGVTFKYSQKGPVGLLTNKKTYVVIASGGTAFKGAVDFASDYVQHFLSFIGINDITFIPADQLMFHAEKTLTNARAIIQEASLVD